MFVAANDFDTAATTMYIPIDVLTIVRKAMCVHDRVSLNIALELDVCEYKHDELEHVIKNIQHIIKCFRILSKHKTLGYKLNGYQVFTSEFSSYIKHRYELQNTGVTSKKLDDIIRRHDEQFPQDAEDAQGTKTPYIWSYVLTDAERSKYMEESKSCHNAHSYIDTCSVLGRVKEKKIKRHACAWNIFVGEMKDVLPMDLTAKEKLWFISSTWKKMPGDIKKMYEKQCLVNKLNYYIQIFDQYISAYTSI